MYLRKDSNSVVCDHILQMYIKQMTNEELDTYIYRLIPKKDLFHQELLKFIPRTSYLNVPLENNIWISAPELEL